MVWRIDGFSGREILEGELVLELGVLTGLSRRIRILAIGRLYSSRLVIERFE